MAGSYVNATPSQTIPDPADPDTKQADSDRDIYFKFRDEIYKGMLSNSQEHDKQLITLSTAILGSSFTFLNTAYPAKTSIISFLYVYANVGFIVSILITLISYLVSQKALSESLSLITEYYLNNNH